jgi:hypothetical protein
LIERYSGDRVAIADEKTNPADFYAELRHRPLVRRSSFSFARPWFNTDATTTAAMLDAHGETLVTKFVIERPQQEVVGVLKDAAGPDGVIPTYRLMERCPADRVAMTDQDTSPPTSTLGYATALS